MPLALDDTVCARLAVLVVLHDIGKFNLGFQAKGRPELGAPAGHVSEALAALWEEPLVRRLAPLGAWGPGATGLLLAAICHHGRPQAQQTHQREWWRPRGGLDPCRGFEELLAACRRWFPSAFVEGGPPLPEQPGFEHAFAGLVMLADWLGSDTRFFPHASEGDAERMPFARARVRLLAAEMGLDVALEDRSDRTGVDAFTRIAPLRWRL